MHVLVTGATSGIGYGIVEGLLERGHFVFAGARSAGPLQDLKQRYSETLEILKLDVTSGTDVANAVEVVSAWPDIRSFALINNAGIAIGGPLEALPLEEWKKVYEVNVFGLVHMTQSFLPLLRRLQGRVINVGSISGRIATPFLSVYTSSKFAVRAISDSLRREVGSLGVRVSLIEPGPVKTKIWGKAMAEGKALQKELGPEHQAVYGSAIKSLIKGVEQAERDAVPVEDVLVQVLHALTSPQPRPYYLIGKNIHLMNFINTALPTGIFDKLLSKGFRFNAGE